MPPRPIFKTFTLSPDQQRRLEDLATTGPFFANILERYRKYGTLTEKQHIAFLKEWEVLSIDGIAVINRHLRDGQILCFHCREIATRAIGNVGVCAAHVALQRQQNSEYEASHPDSM